LKINEKEIIQFKLNGSAGQSLGAFLVKQIEIFVDGDANDYVGKGLSGGKIIIKPGINSNFIPHENVIIGNTVLYGATSGELYANGQAGERFAVRNSGANAVIEGCSNNGCEYMTGGTVVILGKIGENFAAGMTGGMAFIHDADNIFPNYVNRDSVIYCKLYKSYWENILKNLILRHIKFTNSIQAKKIIENWSTEKKKFWQVVPLEIIEKLKNPVMSEKNTVLKKLA
jgi:glutamate synthase (NADPH/NADH) large chain